MDRVVVLMVIYQQNGATSAACQALRAIAYPDVLMVDNSREDFGNAAYCAEAGWQYCSMGGNAGLPKAYNRGIEQLAGQADVVVLLDDDTTLDATYFEALAAARAAHPEGRIFIPRVVDAAGLLSPCIDTGRGFARAETAEDVPTDRLTAINSGMAIDCRVWETYRYDERYFLDFVDHAFMREMRRRGESVVLTDATLTQRFSGSEAYDAQSAKTRFALFRRDGKVYYENRLTYAYAVVRRWLSLKRQAWKQGRN